MQDAVRVCDGDGCGRSERDPDSAQQRAAEAEASSARENQLKSNRRSVLNLLNQIKKRKGIRNVRFE